MAKNYKILYDLMKNCLKKFENFRKNLPFPKELHFINHLTGRCTKTGMYAISLFEPETFAPKFDPKNIKLKYQPFCSMAHNLQTIAFSMNLNNINSFRLGYFTSAYPHK